MIFRLCKNILLWRILLALLCTAFVLLLCKGIYLSKEKYVDASFIVQYEHPEKNHWQIFYNDGTGWKSLPAVYPPPHKKIVQKITFPCEKLEYIRFDLGSNPGRIKMNHIKIQGKKNYSLKDLNKIAANGVKSLEISPERIYCSSDEEDPHIVFALKPPLSGKEKWDYWSFSILLFSTFIIVFAATGLLAFLTVKSCCIADGVFAVCFVAALFVPAMRIDNKSISQEENRKLADFKPLLTSDSKINYQFGKNFDAWFNDHFFGRTSLLNLNSFYTEKTKSPLQKYTNAYSGFEGWYFLSHKTVFRDYHNLYLFPEEQLLRITNELNKIHSICEKYGKKMYVVVVPDKNKVYGEFFPASPKIRPDSQGFANQVVKHISKTTPLPAIYLQDALLANKKTGLLYIKNNTHWNQMGAYYGYLEIMKMIKKDFPALQTEIIKDISHKEISTAGDLGLRFPSSAVYPIPHFTPRYAAAEGEIWKPFTRSRIVNPKGKYKVLFVRDSFASDLLPFMGNSFQSVTALWSSYVISPKDIEAFMESDIVIFECVERFIPQMIAGIHLSRETLEKGVK